MPSHPFLVVALIVTLAVVPAIWVFAPKIMRWGRSGFGDPNSEVGRVAREADEKDRAAILPLLTAVTIVAGVFISFYQFQVSQRAGADRDTWALFVESLKLINQKSAAAAAQRTGAIYALRDIMDQSPGFHNAALVTLVSFIHARRSRMIHPDCRLMAVTSQPDIQAAIDVVGHRPTRWLSSEPDGVLDFQRLCLFGANFHGALLDHANFEQSDLRRTNFDGATVTEVNFTTADFDYQGSGATRDDAGNDERTTAWFKKATHDQTFRFYQLAALFRGANAAGAKFEGSCVRGVDFSHSNLTPANEDDGVDDNFNDAGISLADFDGVSGLSGADAFAGACATESPQNVQTKQNLTCPSVVVGMSAVPVEALPETANDRCNRDIFTGLKPAAARPEEEDGWESAGVRGGAPES